MRARAWLALSPLVIAPLVLVIAPLVGSVALADDEPAAVSPLWLDHAVSTCEHVVLGTYARGAVTAEQELKGQLPARTVFAGGLEVEKTQLAPGAKKLGGRGYFFLQDRALNPGEDPRRLIGWSAPEGVGWIDSETVFFYRPRPDDPEHEAPVAAGAVKDFGAALARSLERETKLLAAIATVDSARRLEALAAIARAPRSGPAAVVADLGVDPFARRALAEIPGCGPGAFEVLLDLRAQAAEPWVKGAAIRLLGTVRGLGSRAARRLEAIAEDAKSSEDEVVAAVDSLFSVDDASLEVLERLSYDPRPRVRASVAMSLCEKVSDLTTLKRLMDDPDANVRERALVAARGAAIRLRQSPDH